MPQNVIVPWAAWNVKRLVSLFFSVLDKTKSPSPMYSKLCRTVSSVCSCISFCLNFFGLQSFCCRRAIVWVSLASYKVLCDPHKSVSNFIWIPICSYKCLRDTTEYLAQLSINAQHDQYATQQMAFTLAVSMILLIQLQQRNKNIKTLILHIIPHFSLQPTLHVSVNHNLWLHALERLIWSAMYGNSIVESNGFFWSD